MPWFFFSPLFSHSREARQLLIPRRGGRRKKVGRLRRNIKRKKENVQGEVGGAFKTPPLFTLCVACASLTRKKGGRPRHVEASSPVNGVGGLAKVFFSPFHPFFYPVFPLYTFHPNARTNEPTPRKLKNLFFTFASSKNV